MPLCGYFYLLQSSFMKQNPVIMLIEVKHLTSATGIKDWAIYHKKPVCNIHKKSAISSEPIKYTMSTASMK